MFPGETAAAGTPVITVMDTSSLLAKLHLAQASTQKLRVGDPAKVTVPGMEDPVQAKMSFISPALDAGSTTVEVWLKLPNRDGRFKVGTPVHAVLQGTTIARALQVPAGGDRAGGRWQHHRCGGAGGRHDEEAGGQGGDPNVGRGADFVRRLWQRHRRHAGGVRPG